jgi:hypothetical protein
MMSIDQRLARLSPVLTAQERAILVLEAWKEGRTEDPVWRRTMPSDQSKAFNFYIDQMNLANRVLGNVISRLHAQAEKVELRWYWLLSLELWQEHIDETRRAVGLSVSEPITESEYGARLAAKREEWAPVEEFAAFLASQRDDWPDEDYEDREDGRYLTDAAWDRGVEEEERKLRAMVARGEIASRGKGKALKLQESVLEHFGHKVGVAPEDFLSYRIVPDSEAAEVEVERNALKYLRQVVSWRDGDNEQEEDDDFWSHLPGKLRLGLRESTAFQLITTWVEVRCIDILVAEVGEHFNGIDPLKPVFREKAEATREVLLSIQDWFKVLQVDVELREPMEEELQELRDWASSIPSASL